MGKHLPYESDTKSQSQGSGQGGHNQVLWLISQVYASTFSKVRGFWQIAQTSLYWESPELPYLTLQPRHQLHFLQPGAEGSG